MGAYVAVGFGSIVFIAIVIILSLATIKKGYSYKHSVDPHPGEGKEIDKETSEKES